MELTDLRYFFNVATSGSFTVGAKLSHVSPPAISKTVKKLEQELDAALFVRTTRRVQLTAQGALLVDHCRRLFAQIDSLTADLAQAEGHVAGELRIGAMEVFSIYLLPVALSRLVRRHPRLVPQSHEMVPQQMERRLSEGRLDLGLTIGGGGAPDIDYHTIGRSRPVLVCGPAHPLFKKGRLTARELLVYPSVVPRFFELEHLPPLDQFPEERYPRARGATIELLQMGIQLAVEGQFLGCFPEISIRQQLRSGQLKALKGLKLDQPFELRALTPKHYRTRPAIEQLISELRRLVNPSHTR